MYNWNYTNHKDVNHYVSENLYVKLNPLKIFKIHTFVPKRIISTLQIICINHSLNLANKKEYDQTLCL